MGLFDRAKKAFDGGGDWAAQAQAAEQLAAEELRKAGYTDGTMPTAADMSGGLGAQMAADQQVLQAYGEELNRIHQIGEAGTGLIKSSVDTGERTAGQAWFQLEVEVALPGKEPHTVVKREMVPEMFAHKYAVGATQEVRVDPADPQKIMLAG